MVKTELGNASIFDSDVFLVPAIRLGVLLSLALAAIGCGGDDAHHAKDAGPDADVVSMMHTDGGKPHAGHDAGPGSTNDASTMMGKPHGAVDGVVYRADTLKPVAGAMITGPGGIQVKTDKLGKFKLTMLATDRTALLANATNFAQAVEPVSVVADQTASVEFRLLHVSAKADVDSSKGGQVRAASGAEVMIDKDAFVDSNGKPVSGAVSVELTVLDPSTPEGMQAFPGDFTATSKAGDDGQLESFVPMEVTVRQGDEVLDFASGKGADISFPVPEGLTDKAPQTIQLWSLNESTGAWVEEGTATLVTDGAGILVYRGRLTHMSWWNCDRFIDSITCIRGCVTRDGKPAGRVTTQAEGIDYANIGADTTGADGCFAEDVKAGGQLRVRALDPLNDNATSDWSVITAPQERMSVRADASKCKDVGTLELIAPKPQDVGCPIGTSKCGRACVDLGTDGKNCGSCGNSCSDSSAPSGAQCIDSQCSCAASETQCSSPDGGNLCTDVKFDEANCGRCGKRCGAGQSCEAGACKQIDCPDGFALCGSACVDVATNSLNCGACGVTCSAGETCRSGACKSLSCAATFEKCGNECVVKGTCPDTSGTDTGNNGSGGDDTSSGGNGGNGGSGGTDTGSSGNGGSGGTDTGSSGNGGNGGTDTGSGGTSTGNAGNGGGTNGDAGVSTGSGGSGDNSGGSGGGGGTSRDGGVVGGGDGGIGTGGFGGDHGGGGGLGGGGFGGGGGTGTGTGGTGIQYCDGSGMFYGACVCAPQDAGSGGGPMCEPGMPRQCDCGIGVGVEYCDGSGTFFGACNCSDAGASGGGGSAADAGVPNGGKDGGTDTSCAPGQTLFCDCATSLGVKTCDPSGTFYGACECGDAGVGGGDLPPSSDAGTPNPGLDGGVTTACEPGQSLFCDCIDGLGVKYCDRSGAFYGECVCGGGTAGAGGGTAGAGGGTAGAGGGTAGAGGGSSGDAGIGAQLCEPGSARPCGCGDTGGGGATGGGSGGTGQMLCTPLSKSPCACPDGPGTRLCNESGSAYSECTCTGGGGSGGIGGGPGDGGMTICAPLSSTPCKCIDGSPGEQLCDQTGTSLGECNCAASDGGVGGPGTTCTPSSGPFPCDCQGGGVGQQFCDQFGTAFSACECGAGGAGGAGGTGGSSCKPASSQPCRCVDGSMGQQFCDDSGTSYGECINCAGGGGGAPAP